MPLLIATNVLDASLSVSLYSTLIAWCTTDGDELLEDELEDELEDDDEDDDEDDNEDDEDDTNARTASITVTTPTDILDKRLL